MIVVTKKVPPGEKGYSHGRSGEGDSERHDQWKGPVQRTGNCGVFSFAGGSVPELPRAIFVHQLGFSYSRSSTSELSNSSGCFEAVMKWARRGSERSDVQPMGSAIRFVFADWECRMDME